MQERELDLSLVNVVLTEANLMTCFCSQPTCVKKLHGQISSPLQARIVIKQILGENTARL